MKAHIFFFISLLLQTKLYPGKTMDPIRTNISEIPGAVNHLNQSLLKKNVDLEKTIKKVKLLWYRQPAKIWERDALPIGNGRLGAMVFGGVEEEKIQFNEISLWSGKPQNADNLDAQKHLSIINKLL